MKLPLLASLLMTAAQVFGGTATVVGTAPSTNFSMATNSKVFGMSAQRASALTMAVPSSSSKVHKFIPLQNLSTKDPFDSGDKATVLTQNQSGSADQYLEQTDSSNGIELTNSGCSGSQTRAYGSGSIACSGTACRKSRVCRDGSTGAVTEYTVNLSSTCTSFHLNVPECMDQEIAHSYAYYNGSTVDARYPF